MHPTCLLGGLPSQSHPLGGVLEDILDKRLPAALRCVRSVMRTLADGGVCANAALKMAGGWGAGSSTTRTCSSSCTGPHSPKPPDHQRNNLVATTLPCLLCGTGAAVHAEGGGHALRNSVDSDSAVPSYNHPMPLSNALRAGLHTVAAMATLTLTWFEKRTCLTRMASRQRAPWGDSASSPSTSASSGAPGRTRPSQTADR